MLAGLLEHARGCGYDRVWVATGDEAKPFYERCGWRFIERLIRADENTPTNVLTISP